MAASRTVSDATVQMPMKKKPWLEKYQDKNSLEEYSLPLKQPPLERYYLAEMLS